MATRRDLKRRIKSIRSTAQITKAMQMVAAARMRKAQERVASSRPYSENINEIVADVAGKTGAEEHPLLARREVRAVEVVVISPDRGLAGGLVGNINRELLRVVNAQTVPVRVVAVGRKATNFAARAGMNVVAEFTGLGDGAGIQDVSPISRQVLDDFENGTADMVYLIYPRFVNTLRQVPTSMQLMPVIPPETAVTAPWNYEPDNPQAVLSDLLPRYVEFTVYQALLELQASFHSAQMIAMSNATDNANELIDDLTLLMNKARQAEITKEVSEITGAAEAIRTG